MAFQHTTFVVVTAVPSPGFGKHGEQPVGQHQARGIASDVSSVPSHQVLPETLPAKGSPQCRCREALLGQPEWVWCSPRHTSGLQPDGSPAADGPRFCRCFKPATPFLPCPSFRNPSEVYAKAQLMQVRFKQRCRKLLSIPASAGEWAPRACYSSASECQDKISPWGLLWEVSSSTYSKCGALYF